MNEYNASLGNLSKIITVSTILFLTALITYLSYKNSIDPRKEYAFAVAFTLFIMMLPVITFFYRPKSYLITEDSLQICRIVGNYRIPYTVINKVLRASKDDMRFTIRTIGNGGLFGFTGNFRNSRFGRMRWFVTQRKNYVIIETNDNKKIVISPDEPEKLALDLQKNL